jgi:hypothetical protein
MTLHLQQARRTAGGRTAASVLDVARRCIDDIAAGRVVSTRDVARVIVGCDDVLVRDALLAGMASEDAQALLAFLVHAVRLAVPPYDAQVAAALAWVAYSGGNGGLANVALDRALATEPAHSLARLVRSAIDHGLPPEELRRVCAATVGELSTRLDLDERPCA